MRQAVVAAVPWTLLSVVAVALFVWTGDGAALVAGVIAALVYGARRLFD